MAAFKARVEGLTGITISSSNTFPTEAQLTEYLKDIKDDFKEGRKLPAKSSIRKRVGDKKYEKLMKKYEDAVFK